MEKIIQFVADQLIERGFNVVILAGLVWYFYTEMQKIKKKLDETQLELTKYLKEDRKELINIIERNTRVFEDFEDFVSNFNLSPKKK